MTGRRFSPAEPCAIEPKAFGFMLAEPFTPPPNEVRGDVVVVNARGPLMHHVDTWCDSYDAIKARVAEALAARPRVVVLAIDSPGGLVSGCFDTADEIRALAKAAGVSLMAYVDGHACSAAYALACAASVIVVPPTGVVGSIGCIAEIVSLATADAAMGVERRIVVSGARKPDGNPGAPITDGAVAAMQAQVDRLAGLFFEHVAAVRPSTVDELRALEAGVFVGADAVPLGLADAVMGLDEMVAAFAAGTIGSAARPAMNEEQKTMSDTKSPYEMARANLQAIADDEKADEKERAKAKAALAAMDGDGDEKKPEPPVSNENKAEHEEPDGDEAKAIASKALAAVRELQAQATKARKEAEDAERASLLASRADLDEPTRNLLAAAPIEQVRAFVKTAPKRVTKPAAGVTVPVTRGAGQGDDDVRATSEGAAQVAAALGKTFVQPSRGGTRETFPAMTREERAAYRTNRAAAKSAPTKTA